MTEGRQQRQEHLPRSVGRLLFWKHLSGLLLGYNPGLRCLEECLVARSPWTSPALSLPIHDSAEEFATCQSDTPLSPVSQGQSSFNPVPACVRYSLLASSAKPFRPCFFISGRAAGRAVEALAKAFQLARTWPRRLSISVLRVYHARLQMQPSSSESTRARDNRLPSGLAFHALHDQAHPTLSLPGNIRYISHRMESIWMPRCHTFASSAWPDKHLVGEQLWGDPCLGIAPRALAACTSCVEGFKRIAATDAACI